MVFFLQADVHEQTLAITLDSVSQKYLENTWPKVHSILWNVPCLKVSFIVYFLFSGIRNFSKMCVQRDVMFQSIPSIKNEPLVVWMFLREVLPEIEVAAAEGNLLSISGSLALFL